MAFKMKGSPMQRNFGIGNSPLEKNDGFLSDLWQAVKTVPKAIEEGPVAHAKQIGGKVKEWVKSKRKK